MKIALPIFIISQQSILNVASLHDIDRAFNGIDEFPNPDDTSCAKSGCITANAACVDLVSDCCRCECAKNQTYLTAKRSCQKNNRTYAGKSLFCFHYLIFLGNTCNLKF